MNSNYIVLIVNDDDRQRAELRERLHQHVKVLECDNEETAIHFLEKPICISVIFLGLQMPELNGFDLLRWMQKQGLTEHIPVIVTASFYDRSIVEYAYELGCSDFVIEPMTDQILHRKLNLMLRLFESENTLAELTKKEKNKYNTFAEMSNEIQFELSLRPDILRFTRIGTEIYGLPEVIDDPFHNDDFLKILGVDNYYKLRNAFLKCTDEEPNISIDFPVETEQDTHWYHLICNISWIEIDGERMPEILGKAIDITEFHERMESLKTLSDYDSLTGLLNHSAAIQEIKKAMAAHPEKSVAIAVLDIDRFKEANDRYGHRFGDQVLMYVSERLQEAARESDIVARFGGDEFLIYIQHNGHPEIIFDRIKQSINGFMESYAVSVSIGIACDCEVGRDFDALFSAADQALYHLKDRRPGGYCFYRKPLTAAMIHD